MSKAKKLYDKLMGGHADRNFAFADAALALKYAGFTLDVITGSHHIFRHASGRHISLPFHGKELHAQYVKQVRELLK